MNKHRWLNMNYKVHNSEILILKILKITLSIKKNYESILSDLSISLNNYHNLGWKKNLGG